MLGYRKTDTLSPGPLAAMIVISVALIMILIVLVCVLYRRKQLYGGFYICATPPKPDYIMKLDPHKSLIEQVHKLPYDEYWEVPRELLHMRKYSWPLIPRILGRNVRIFELSVVPVIGNK